MDRMDRPGRLTLLAGSGHPALADAVAARLGVAVGVTHVSAFPDGELHVAVRDSVRGDDVYVLQPTGPRSSGISSSYCCSSMPAGAPERPG